MTQETKKLEHSSKATILTDRAIYRPGQRLYGKEIVTQKKDGKESMLENTLVSFEILDAKKIKLKELILPTNEFGSFTFEYDIRVNNLGDFSNGITTIQSMYAPEFSSHTKGIRVKTYE